MEVDLDCFGLGVPYAAESPSGSRDDSMVHSHFLTFLLLFDSTCLGGGVPFLVLGAGSTDVSTARVERSPSTWSLESSSEGVLFCSGISGSVSKELTSSEMDRSLLGISTTNFSSPSNLTFLTGGKNIRRVVCGLPLSAENNEYDRFMPSFGECGAFFKIDRSPMGCAYGRERDSVRNDDRGVEGDGRGGITCSELAMVLDVVGVVVLVNTLAEPSTPFDDFAYGDGSDEVCSDSFGRPSGVIVVIFAEFVGVFAPLWAIGVVLFSFCEDVASP